MKGDTPEPKCQYILVERTTDLESDDWECEARVETGLLLFMMKSHNAIKASTQMTV